MLVFQYGIATPKHGEKADANVVLMNWQYELIEVDDLNAENFHHTDLDLAADTQSFALDAVFVL